MAFTPSQVYLNGIVLTKKVLLADGNRLKEKVSGNNEDNQVSNLFLCSTCFYFYSDHTKLTFETNYLLTLFNTTGATSGAETANPSEAPEFTPVLVGFVLLDLLFYVYVL